MRKRHTVLSLLILSALGLTVWVIGCSEAKDPWDGKPTPHILVSVPPLYSWAKSIAGEHGDVKCLCTDTGPHHYEHSTNDLHLLGGATRFFTVGLHLDNQFTDPMMKTLPADSGVRVVLGNKLPADLKLKIGSEDDPHVWLGTEQAIVMVKAIRDELKKVDPDHEADYEKNTAAYVKELEKLRKDGLALLKDKKDRRIISFHDSLEYFAKEFDIKIVDVIEEGPGQEPGTKKMIDLVDKCVAENVHVIAVEPQYPTTSAAAVLLGELKKKGKTDVELVEIDPLETASAKELSADLYVKTMRQNLENLAKNLK